jgi:hypothetical protein
MREVIELATRIPSGEEGISLADLRQIARDLDIDQDALDQAITDVLRRPSARLRVTKIGHLLARHPRAIAGGLIASFLGWLSGHVTDALREVINGVTLMRGSGAFIDVPVAIALFSLTFLNSLSRRLSGRRKHYFIETLAMWGAFFLARSLQDGYITQDGTWFVAIALLGFGLWGWLIIRPRQRRSFAETPPTEHDTAPDRTKPQHEGLDLQPGRQFSSLFWTSRFRPRGL